MKRIVSMLLCASLAASGCGVRLSVGPRAWPGKAKASAPQSITSAYAEKLPIGSKVKVAVKSGDSFSATYMGVEGDAVRVQKRTRIPEAPLVIPLADLTVLALDQGGMDTTKAVLIGVGVGVASFFGILAIAAAAWND